MNQVQLMKTTRDCLAESSRVIRKKEVKLRNKARKSKSRRNFNYFNRDREDLYAVRMKMRVESRHTNLILAYLGGKHDYKTVEQSTREGNEPNMDEISFLIFNYNMEDVLDATDIEEWIKGEAS